MDCKELFQSSRSVRKGSGDPEPTSDQSDKFEMDDDMALKVTSKESGEEPAHVQCNENGE